MQLTDEATKLKLFMDVLDGTKATVRFHGKTFIFLYFKYFLLVLNFTPLTFLYLLS